jgi:type IV pilus assembly protein PilF
MLRLIICWVVVGLLLGGCVKQASYDKTGKPAPTSRIDNTEAAKTRVALGLQYLKVGQMSSAKYNLEKAKNFAPELSSVYTAFAYYYQKVGEEDLAEQAYLKAINLDANDADALNNYGTFLCKMKRFDEAEETLLRAIKVPSYLQVAQSYENAALCAMENQQYDQAKQYFTQSLEHSALRVNTLVNVAGLSYAMGEYKTAQKYGQRLANVGVVSPRVLLLRALIELKLGRATQSKKYGTTLVSMYVKSPEALMYLSKSFENSEFEQLRRLYLKHQYQQFKRNSKQQSHRDNVAKVSAKIKKKLKPGENGTSIAVNVTEPAKSNQTEQVSVKAKPKPKPNKPVETRTAQIIETKPAKILEVPYHRLKMGETLFDVSFTYNIKMKSLQKWNRLKDKSQIRAGQIIYLNNPDIYYTAGEGDTLYDISLKYKIHLDHLLQWNDLTEHVQLNVGQKILIVNPKQYFL